MVGTVIWCVTMFGCAVLFFGIGVWAQKREAPMHFWSGVDVEASEISDVRQYNEENASLWKGYSLWYVGAGLAWIWSQWIALAFLALGCTVGIVLLIGGYRRIYEKYRVK